MIRLVKLALLLALITATIVTLHIAANYIRRASSEKDIRIAHACGEIDGHKYTNCREALELAKSNGYKYIEIDLQRTTDSVLVAVHEWGQFRGFRGDSLPTETSMSHKEFMKSKLFGKYTTMDYNDINDFFLANPDITFVVDKIDDADILDKYFSRIKGQMLVESFGMEEYLTLQEWGFTPMWSGINEFYRNRVHRLTNCCSDSCVGGGAKMGCLLRRGVYVAEKQEPHCQSILGREGCDIYN